MTEYITELLIMESSDLLSLSRNELIKLCKEKSIKGYSTKKKDELIQLIQDSLSTSSDTAKTTTTSILPQKRKRFTVATLSENIEQVEKVKKVQKVEKVEKKKNDTEVEKEFSHLSIRITKMLSTSDKKDNGIYFTPNSIIQDTIQKIKSFHTFKTVLEPSCGSCEFIRQIDIDYTDISITGIELNKTIYNNLNLTFKNRVELLNQDFLKFNNPNKYDLIIGNPPYFVMPKGDVPKEYLKYFDGRPNIFSLFIVKSLQLLTQLGVLSFVLPNSFLNSMYYNKLRKYISENYTIVDITNHSQKSYLETQQDTCVIIIQNHKPSLITNQMFSYSCKDGSLLFHTKDTIQTIKGLYNQSKTLDELGFEVKVGNIVWNQHKDILTEDESKTLLIYSSDIKDNTLCIKKYTNDEKKNYIDKEGNNGLLLVVNRGYGKGKYSFSYLLVDLDRPYLIENHLICIKPKVEMEYFTLKHMYQKIILSFADSRTADFVDLYFGNNAISTTELQHILPIYYEQA